MRTAAAAKFAAAPSAEKLAALWKKEPQTAASFFVEYARAAGLSGKFVDSLDKVLSTKSTDEKKDKALVDLLAKSPKALSAFKTAEVQAARVKTLGFEVGTPSSATLSGTVQVEHDTIYLKTDQGRFAVDSPNYESSLQYRHLEANVLRSWEGKTVTVRAWPTPDTNRIAVEEFAPGTSAQFVSGRLTTENGVPGVRVRPDKVVFFRDPEFAAKMKPFCDLTVGNQTGGRTGVILPGKVAFENGKFYFDSDPKDFWMLCKELPGTGQLEMGHGQRHAFSGDITPKTGASGGRIMVFGHINADGSVTAKGAVATPATRVESGIPYERSPLKLIKDFPLTDTEKPAEKDFGL